MDAKKRLTELESSYSTLERAMNESGLPEFIKKEAQFKLDNIKKEIDQLTKVLASQKVRDAIKQIREI